MASITSRRSGARLAGDRETQAIAATLGRAVRDWRRIHGVTLEQLARRVGIGRSRLAQLELGKGGNAPLGLWVATGHAINRPLAVGFSRAVEGAPLDGGHLGIQELLLRLGRACGRTRTFELQTRSLRSVDVGLRDDRQRVLILSEIWNTITDVGAAKRDTDRKVEEVRQLAAAQSTGFRVASCWVVRATAANRALLARYPSVFEAAFPGSSRGWVRALAEGSPPPDQPGLVWADVAGTRLLEWRRRSADGSR
jgi:transcriptional regulator with XRE-family HTH domain